VSLATACDDCLRRAFLLGALAGHIEHADRRAGRLGQLLALGDRDLVDALTPADGRRQVLRAHADFDAGRARARCAAVSVVPLCRHGDGYPARLLDAADAPAVLHVFGDAGTLSRLCGPDPAVPAVAVVGARRATPYGLDVARALGRGLAGAGVAVVSGMALGVDSAAHVGALDAQGPTIAVLASGADVASPASKASLHRRIAHGGCVVSEMPPGSRPRRWGFPARNRIIAALAGATVVVEADERSGSLITAEIAADLGRPVGAVPGAVTSRRSAGTNALLRDGADVVRDVRDALDLASLAPLGHLAADAGARRAGTAGPAVALDEELRRALASVEDGHDSPDRLARVLGGDIVRATVVLARLEIAGVLSRRIDGRYARRAGA
jgi:DNA processing protein